MAAGISLVPVVREPVRLTRNCTLASIWQRKYEDLTEASKRERPSLNWNARAPFQHVTACRDTTLGLKQRQGWSLPRHYRFAITRAMPI